MEKLQLALSIVQVIACLFLIVVVLLQHGATQGLSGAIAGGAETFFGKGKAKGLDAILGRMTTFAAVIFILLSLVLNII